MTRERSPAQVDMHGLFDEQHEILRKTVRRFVENEIVPHVDTWEEKGCTPRELSSAGLVSRVTCAPPSHGC